jgi:hypothetical protein
MPVDQRNHGVYGQVSMDPTGGSTVAVVAEMNGWTLDMSRDRQPAVAFGDTNIIRVAGLPDFSGTLSGLWNAVATSSPVYFDAVLAGTPVTLRLIPNRNDATVYFEGLANIDGSVNVSATGVVSTGGAWDAAGNWTMAP